jgi:hypothetical protein
MHAGGSPQPAGLGQRRGTRPAARDTSTLKEAPRVGRGPAPAVVAPRIGSAPWTPEPDHGRSMMPLASLVPSPGTPCTDRMIKVLFLQIDYVHQPHLRATTCIEGSSSWN